MKEPSFDYDKDADVMYITFGDAEPCKSHEMAAGVIFRYTLKEELNGITIIDYKKRTEE